MQLRRVPNDQEYRMYCPNKGCGESSIKFLMGGVPVEIHSEASTIPMVVLPDGKTLVGEKALPEIMKRLKKYSGAADLFRLPGAQTLSRVLYRWFAVRRYSIARLLGIHMKKDHEKSGT